MKQILLGSFLLVVALGCSHYDTKQEIKSTELRTPQQVYFNGKYSEEGKSCWNGHPQFVKTTNKDKNLLSFLFDWRTDHEILDATFNFISQNDPQLAEQLKSAYSELNFEMTHKSIKDKNLIGQASCGNQLLAAQDVESKTVLVDADRYEKMPLLEQTFLRVQQALVRIQHLQSQQSHASSIQITQKLQTLLDSPAYYTFVIKQTYLNDVENPYDFYTAVFITGHKSGTSSGKSFRNTLLEMNGKKGQVLEGRFYSLGNDANEFIQSDIVDIFQVSGVCKPFSAEKRDWRNPVSMPSGLDEASFRFGSRVCPVK